LKQERLGYLDSARGLAAIVVLLFHAIISFAETDGELVPTVEFFRYQFEFGKVFLLQFFFISGFVIPYSMNGEGKNAIKSFAISRFFRLYPVYWASAIAAFYLFGTFTYVDLIVNFTMLQQFFGVENIIGLYWTLQLELIFYVLIIIVFAMNKLYNRKFLFQLSLLFLLASLGMAFARYQLSMKLPLALPLALSLMFFGAYYRMHVLKQDLQAKKLSQYYMVAFFILIPIISFLGYDVDYGFGESWEKYTITYYLGMLLFIAICKYKVTNRFLEYSGKTSYSLYVFHPLAIYIIQTNTIFDDVNGFLKMLIVWVATGIFAHFTFYLIEQRSINFGRKLRKRIVKV